MIYVQTIAPGSRLGWFTCNPLFAERLERQAGEPRFKYRDRHHMTFFTISPETTIQTPCGFGASLVTQLLTHWKYEGYIRWVRGSSYVPNGHHCSQMILIVGLGTQYTLRRDKLIDCLDEEFDLQISTSRSGVWEGCDYYVASKKSGGKNMSEKILKKTMFSFVPPTSGMFVWVRDSLNIWLSLAYNRLDKATFREHPSIDACGGRVVGNSTVGKTC